VAPGLTESVVLTALDSMLTALDPTGPIPMLMGLDLKHPIPMLTPLDLMEGIPMLTTALVPMEGMPMLTALVLTEGMPMLTALPTDCKAFLTAPDPAERMASLTTPDLTVGPVEVDHLSFPGPKEDDLNLCPVGAADWSRVTATSSETLERSTTAKESRPTTTRGPS
jgi:hypothetical protein